MSRVYIGRLSNHTRERDLEEAFGKFGRITRTDLKYGYAFVEFEDSRDADDAVKEMDGRNLDGERIIVEHAKGPARGSDRRDRDRDRDRDDRDRDRDRAPTRPSEGRCFNCGGGGHWARDCPDEGGRDRCFNCGRNGHLARECREGRRSSRGRYHPYRRSRSRSRSPRRSRKSSSKSPRRSSSPKKSSRSPSHSPTREKEDKDNKEKENDQKSP